MNEKSRPTVTLFFLKKRFQLKHFFSMILVSTHSRSRIKWTTSVGRRPTGGVGQDPPGGLRARPPGGLKLKTIGQHELPRGAIGRAPRGALVDLKSYSLSVFWLFVCFFVRPPGGHGGARPPGGLGRLKVI